MTEGLTEWSLDTQKVLESFWSYIAEKKEIKKVVCFVVYLL